MRLSNRKKEQVFSSINTLLMLFLWGGVAVFLVNNSLNILGNTRYLFLIFPLILIIIYLIRGRQIFEYDSDGETLNFKNRGIIPFRESIVSDEVPKYQLKNYNVVNGFIFKKLHIIITRKKSNIVTLKYDISYLTKREIRDLKHSLNKVIKANSEQKI